MDSFFFKVFFFEEISFEEVSFEEIFLRDGSSKDLETFVFLENLQPITQLANLVL